MGVLSDTGERSFPTGLRVRWRSGEERDGAKGREDKERNSCLITRIFVAAALEPNVLSYHVVQTTGEWSRVWLKGKN